MPLVKVNLCSWLLGRPPHPPNYGPPHLYFLWVDISGFSFFFHIVAIQSIKFQIIAHFPTVFANNINAVNS